MQEVKSEVREIVEELPEDADLSMDPENSEQLLSDSLMGTPIPPAPAPSPQPVSPETPIEEAPVSPAPVEEAPVLPPKKRKSHDLGPVAATIESAPSDLGAESTPSDPGPDAESAPLDLGPSAVTIESAPSDPGPDAESIPSVPPKKRKSVPKPDLGPDVVTTEPAPSDLGPSAVPVESEIPTNLVLEPVASPERSDSPVYETIRSPIPIESGQSSDQESLKSRAGRAKQGDESSLSSEVSTLAEDKVNKKEEHKYATLSRVRKFKVDGQVMETTTRKIVDVTANKTLRDNRKYQQMR